MTNTLASGGTLTTNESITSTNGLYTLVMQGPGSLVLMVVSTSYIFWSTNTTGRKVSCTMEGTGNLVVGNANVLWQSNTTSKSAYLELLDDGNLVIYNLAGAIIWATNTTQVGKALAELKTARSSADAAQRHLASAETAVLAALESRTPTNSCDSPREVGTEANGQESNRIPSLLRAPPGFSTALPGHCPMRGARNAVI
jgi:hypothetical protein